MSADRIATITGGFAAAATAAQPVLNGIGGASLHQGDYFQLLSAVFIGILGYFTNKNK